MWGYLEGYLRPLTTPIRLNNEMMGMSLHA
jgi:hypothetical protein